MAFEEFLDAPLGPTFFPRAKLRIATERMAAVMRESNEARGLAMTLRGNDVSPEILADMNAHSVWCEKAHAILQSLVKKNVTSADTYNPIYAKLDAKNVWYTPRRAAAKSIETTLKRQYAGTPNSSTRKKPRKSAADAAEASES